MLLLIAVSSAGILNYTPNNEGVNIEAEVPGMGRTDLIYLYHLAPCLAPLEEEGTND